MLTLDKKIKKWSRKVNRNKSFTPIEMVEMEDHLLVEIKQMVQYDGMTEEEAFQKALKTLGEQGILDEEFGKIRRSAFDKVKLWAYLQTFVILALVVFIVAPYIHLPKKNISGFITGEKIGEIYKWAYKTSKEFFNFKYSQDLFDSFSLQFVNNHLNTETSFSCLTPFDYDFKNDVYILNNKEKNVDVFRNSQKVKEIQIPQNT